MHGKAKVPTQLGKKNLADLTSRHEFGRKGGGTNRSDAGLNLSGSWQQGHSATYNTPRPPRLVRREGQTNDMSLWGPGPLLQVGKRAAGARVASSPDSDLEAFSHNPAHGSFAPLAFQPSAMTNCANQRVKLTCLTTV
ncbi:unnamed protein product [Malus baccata var. baccata]